MINENVLVLNDVVKLLLVFCIFWKLFLIMLNWVVIIYDYRKGVGFR